MWLTKVKSFANDIQSALTAEEEELTEQENTTSDLTKLNELAELTTTQEKEIVAQRKQILELQQKLKSLEEHNTAKNSTDTKDSWFWDDAETNTPSTSSSSKTKDEHGESPVIVVGDLTNIPLDSGGNDQDLHKQLVEKEQKLKKLILENAIVNEKLTQISSENRELNDNIEELDKQHCLAVENILGMKQTLQDQLTRLQQQHDRLIKQSEDDTKKNVEQITALEAQNAKLERLLAESKTSIEKIEKSYTTSLQENVENQKKIDSLYTELKVQTEKSSSDSTSQEKEMSNKLAALEVEKRKIEQDLTALQEEDLIRQRELSQLKAELDLKLAELSEVVTEKRKWEQDFHALQDDDLSLQALHRALEEKLVVLESQTVPKARFEELEKNYGALERKLRKSKTPDSARDREIENLLAEKLKVEQDLIALQDEDLTLQTEYRNLQEAYDELEKKVQTCDADNTEVLQLRKQLEDNANELSVLNLENTKLKEHFEIDRNQLEEQVFSLEEKYAEMVQKCEELDRKLKAAETNPAKGDDVDQLRLTNSNISTMNQQMSETYKILSDKLLVAELELSEIKNHFEQKVSKIQNLEQEKTNLTQIIENLKSHEETPAAAVVASDSLTENEVLDLLRKYLDYEYESDDDKPERKHLEDFLRSHRDLQSKHYALERKLIEFSKDITSIKDQNAKLLHEKETMKADLLNYEIECTELMKNNGLLLSQLEAVQSNKLETIHENNEDNIVVLERQLEQCNNLNENLEEKYHKLKEQFSTMLSKNEPTTADDASFDSGWDETVQKLKQQIEHLENDKSNLLFEINDLKADRSVLETEMLDYKSRAESTEEQHAVVTEDLAHVVAKLHALEKQHSEANSRYEETIDAQAKVIADKEKELKSVQADMKQLQRDVNQADSMGKTNESLVASLQSAEQNCARFAEQVKAFEAKEAELQTQHEQEHQALLTEKNDLITLVTTKHNENVQYHTEIQRLGQLLMAEIEKNKTLSHAASEPCQSCRQLQEELTVAKESASSHISGEVEKMTDQIQFLKEKSDILTKNIMMEQSNQKLLNQECVELKEQKQALVKETDRLRQHLLEIEESHTMETVELQKTIDDLRQKLSHIEMDAKQSSTAYTSASIRANQQAETLQAQCQLLQQQRDEIANRLSAFEDHEFKNQAALTNLQCALEQFQKDKDRDIEAATYRIQKELEFERQQRAGTIKDYQVLQQQLAEAKHGLLAAARLSDQLEISHVQNAGLKDELKKLQERYAHLESKMASVESSQADKVEKNLVKNLVIGYVSAPNANDKLQILKLISHVLDLSPPECDKVGLGSGRSQGGWLGGILSGGGGAGGNFNKESLAQAFVMFLEKESQPNPAGPASLLTLLDQPTPTSVAQQSEQQQHIPPAPSATTTSVVAAVQPILLGNENILHQSFVPQPQRNSSAILKDILNDKT